MAKKMKITLMGTKCEFEYSKSRNVEGELVLVVKVLTEKFRITVENIHAVTKGRGVNVFPTEGMQGDVSVPIVKAILAKVLPYQI